MAAEAAIPDRMPAEEKQLCLHCLSPNDPEANFCEDCGAPLTSYAATGPQESIFAEGHLYRQAIQQPRKFIVVAGIWLLFGSTIAPALALLPFSGSSVAIPDIVAGVLMLAIFSLVVLQTTFRYIARPRRADAESGIEG